MVVKCPKCGYVHHNLSYKKEVINGLPCKGCGTQLLDSDDITYVFKPKKQFKNYEAAGIG